MNWFKKAQSINIFSKTNNLQDEQLKYYRDYEEEDLMEHLNTILEEEFEEKDFRSIDRKIIHDQIEDMLNSFPPGYKLRKSPQGWSVVSPQGDIVSLNEEDLFHSIPGGKARFDFMGLSI